MEGVDYVITKAEEAYLAEIISRNTVHRTHDHKPTMNRLHTKNAENLPSRSSLPLRDGKREG